MNGFKFGITFFADDKGVLRFVDNATGKTLKFDKSLKKVSQSATKTNQSIQNNFKKTVAVLVAVLAAFQGFSLTYRNAVLKPIQEAAAFETYELQIKQFVGNARAARREILKLAKIAAATPFRLDELIKADKILLAFGIRARDSARYLRLVGDAAAATGQPLDNIAFWFGRAYAAIRAGEPLSEVQLRLTELGLAIPGVRSKMEALRKAGASGAEVWKLFTTQFQKTSGAMKDLSSTLSGRISTLEDTWKEFLRQIGRNGPLEAATGSVKLLIGQLQGYVADGDLAAAIGRRLTESFFALAIPAVKTAIAIANISRELRAFLHLTEKAAKKPDPAEELAVFETDTAKPEVIAELALFEAEPGAAETQAAALVAGVKAALPSQIQHPLRLKFQLRAQKIHRELLAEAVAEAVEPLSEQQATEIWDKAVGQALAEERAAEELAVFSGVGDAAQRAAEDVKAAAEAEQSSLEKLLEGLEALQEKVLASFEEQKKAREALETGAEEPDPSPEFEPGPNPNSEFLRKEREQRRARLKSEALSLINSLQSETERYKEAIALLEAAFRETDLDIELTEDQKARALEALEQRLAALSGQLPPEVRNLVESVKTEAEKLDAALKLLEANKDAINIIDPELFEQTKNRLIQAFEQVHQAAKPLEGLADSLLNTFNNAFIGLVDGTGSVEEAYKAMYQTLLQHLLSYIQQELSARITADGIKGALTAKTVARNQLEAGSEMVSATAKTNSAHASIPFVGAIIAAALIAVMMASMRRTRSETATITKLAKGTLVDAPTLALIGEAGPELVAPKKDFLTVMREFQPGFFRSPVVPGFPSDSRAQAGGGPVLNQHFHGPVFRDDRQWALQMKRGMRSLELERSR